MCKSKKAVATLLSALMIATTFAVTPVTASATEVKMTEENSVEEISVDIAETPTEESTTNSENIDTLAEGATEPQNVQANSATENADAQATTATDEEAEVIITEKPTANEESNDKFAGKITFEIPESWREYNTSYYAHIWNEITGESLYSWQTVSEKMTANSSETLATYNVPKGDWNMIIISGDSGVLTYDSVFNKSCIGDTCYTIEDTTLAPVDGSGEVIGLYWRNNPDCGPHKKITALGKVVGSAYLPDETDQTIYDDFVKKYNPVTGTESWNDNGLLETGITWEEITASLADELDIVTESVSLNKSALTLGVGEAYTLKKTVTPSTTACTWSSSNTKVATVSSNGKITAKSAGTATITVKTASGTTATCAVTVKNAPNKISLNKTKITLGVGEKYDLNSSLPKGTASYSVKYSSNNASVATVKSAGGLVTAKKAGTATITATTYNGKKVICTVTVKNAPSKISLNKTKITLGVGETYDLNSSLPSGTASYSVKYTTNNSSVATVKSAGGLVTAKKAGTATITATTYNGKKVTCTVTVKKAPDKVSLNKTTITLGVGETFDLNSSLPAGTASYNTTYSTNAKGVLTVKSAGGLVTAKRTGTAEVTVKTYNGRKATCLVHIKNEPNSISLNKTKITLGVGETFDLNSSLPAGTASYSVKYSSNKTSVATVKSAGGLVTGKKAGTATITATTYNGKKATCTVTVKNAPSSISLNKKSITLYVGEIFDLNSSLPSGTASYRTKYSSNNSDVASVKSAGGYVTANKAGTAIITATTYNGKTATCKVTVKNKSYSNADIVIHRINKERYLAGNEQLPKRNDLCAIADIRAKEIAQKFDAVRPDGTYVNSLMDSKGMDFSYVVEVYAQCPPELTKEEFAEYLMLDSEMADLANGDYDGIGAGYYKDSSGIEYWIVLYVIE